MSSSENDLAAQLAEAGIEGSVISVNPDGTISEMSLADGLAGLGGLFDGLTGIGAPMHEENQLETYAAPAYITTQTITTDSVTVAAKPELSANEAMGMFMAATGEAAEHLYAGHDVPEPVVFVQDGRIAIRFTAVCTH